MVQTIAALAEPTRFRIVELLRGGPRTVKEVSDRLDLSQPQTSKHLRVLRAAGLVMVEPRAQQRLYELRAQPLRRLHHWLERYWTLWDSPVNEMDQILEEFTREPSSVATR